MRRVACVWLLLLVGVAAEALAQPVEPIGPYVLDVRGSLARFKGAPLVAAGLGVDEASLPTRGLGLTAGAHWYPFRRGPVTFGIGAELVVARDSRAEEPAGATVQMPTVTTRLSGFSPQVSLNFGDNGGWSYLTGGIGLARLTSTRDDWPATDGVPRVRSLNYGGGARWFTTPRTAFTFDVRFYTINPQDPVGFLPAYPRARFMVISVGMSLR